MSWLQERIYGLAHLFFPRLCEGCHSPLLHVEKLLCLHCESALPLTDFHHLPENDAVLRLSGRVPFQHATALAYFTEQGLMQHLIHGLKYQARKETGVYLGTLLGNKIAPLDWKINAVVPVPLHPKRHARRGYNQSSLIATGVADALGVEMIERALIRNRYTESQTDKSRDERMKNVSGAFTLERGDRLNGQHILLVDDVLTTGATLEACIEALLNAKNVRVSVATVAIAS